MNQNEITKTNALISDALDKKDLKKMILSQSTDPKVKKAVATLVSDKDGVRVKIESFTSDNKALTEILDIDEAKFVLPSLTQGFFKQTNINTSITAKPINDIFNISIVIPPTNNFIMNYIFQHTL